LQNKILFSGQGQEDSQNIRNVTKNENKKLGFRLFFLGKKDLDMEVMEVEKIDFENVKRRLELGESVFMATIQPPSSKSNLFIETEESWYFPRI